MLKQEDRESPCLTSAGNMCIGQLRFSKALSTSTNGHKSTVIINLEVTNKCQHVDNLTNMEPMHNEDWLYLYNNLYFLKVFILNSNGTDMIYNNNNNHLLNKCEIRLWTKHFILILQLLLDSSFTDK